MSDPALLMLDSVGHAYFGKTVLEGVSLGLEKGEIVALIGPSGCGKSTLLHIAAGIIAPLFGRVAAKSGRFAMVFQDPRLLPWATARDNIGYPLQAKGEGRAARARKIAETAARVALAPEDLDKYPAELSGGMRQRAAVARAMTVDPDLIFFDEPFSALDAALKRHLQDMVISAAKEAHFGALFVTHDLLEATRIAHRVLVMDTHGRGIVGERAIPGQPGERDEAGLFRLVGTFLGEDSLFRHIHDQSERGDG